MSNPYAAGGGGTQFETRVVASALVAVLCEAPFRGLPGEFATEVSTQRAAFDEPLDDIVVQGVREDGRATKLSLQIKNKITFTEGGEEWADVLQRAWDTVSKDTFDPVLHRVGVGIGTYTARADQHYQAVLNWAEHSPDAKNFRERVTARDYSHKDKKAFVETIEKILFAHTGRNVTDEELWKLLKAFVIIHFDFQSEERSRDALNVVDRLSITLATDARSFAPRIWDHLINKAGMLIPVGGGATRQSLVAALQAESLPVGPAASLWRHIHALGRDSQRALFDIKLTIHGLRLHRADSYEKIQDALKDSRFVQISGQPGSGKSALLKEIAEERLRKGPVFVLKDTRIHAKGWSAHAHIVGITDDIPALLREFSCTGEPVLFIDGIDKIVDPAVQLTVNDLLKAIAGNDALSDWRILATVREQNLQHLETWLDGEALKKLPLRTIDVGTLSDDELSIVATKFPRLGALLSAPGNVDVILRRPFFLDAILNLAGRNASAQLPATEVELLKLWWELGASDRTDFSASQHRRNVLVELADRLAHSPKQPISIRNVVPEPIEELKSAGVIRDKELGHSVVFTHDIYEEWSLCQMLIGSQGDLGSYLKAVGEPDLLIRPVQLLGAFTLETGPNADGWKALYEKTADGALRPGWQRTVLTSCLQSTRTTELLSGISDYLSENEYERLKKLLLALATIEVVPNPLFLDEKVVPGLAPEERAKFAHYTAVPKPLTWVRFLNWLMPFLPKLPPNLIPELLPVLSTWQNTYAGSKVRRCREIGVRAHTWLKEFEEALHPGNFNERRAPFDGQVRGEKTEEKIRSLFLASAGDVPQLVAAYLKDRCADRDHVHMFRDDILKNCGALIRHLPTELVDFILCAFFKHPKDDKNPLGIVSDHDADELGLDDHFQFYPASPAQLPFLNLLKLHEEEGLRLIRSICNFSIEIWRWRLTNRSRADVVTPISVVVNFPWGEQSFWGDVQVYTWFRGTWGNHACQSGLMALEQWAFEQIDSGKKFDEIFQKVIEGNESVAALGVGVSLCLAHPNTAFANAVPLITCPHLWLWDVQRAVHDMGGMPSNEIGNWFQYKELLTAVRKLNQRSHRKETLRNLAPYIIYKGDDGLRKAYTKELRRFPRRLPFSFEEEKKNKDWKRELGERAKLFVEQGDPKYWKAERTTDGIQISNDPPSLKTEKYQVQQQEHVELSEAMGVAMWAQKSLENGALDERLSVVKGVEKARQWDIDALFETRTTDDFNEQQRTAAVSGAAFVAAMFATEDEWTTELQQWCMDVLARAATAPERPDRFTMRMSVVVLHPAVFAAHAYSALVAKKRESERAKEGLLNLAVDALIEVQRSVFVSAQYYADSEPDFVWTLLVLALRMSIGQEGTLPDIHSVMWTVGLKEFAPHCHPEIGLAPSRPMARSRRHE
jgi:hypothetical protein